MKDSPVLLRSLAFFLLAVALTAICFFPGLSGPFMFDDEPNIARNSAIHLNGVSQESLVLATTSYGEGLFKRPLSMASLAFNHLLTGLDPFWFKVTNLLVHLTNGFLVFLLCRLWVRALHPARSTAAAEVGLEWLPLAVAAAWMVHPLNLTSVLYVVQRMTSLGAFFTLLGMLLYMQGRLRLRAGQRSGWPLIYAGILGGTLLAFLAKENGVLLPLYLLVTEWILFRFDDSRRSVRLALGATFILVVGVPLVVGVAFFAVNPLWLFGGYDGRSFDLIERLLTQPRVISFYLKLLLVPSLQELSLYHDDIEISTGWTQPWTTLPALVALGLLLAAAVALRRRLPVLAFGVLFFFAGHALESTLFPLEMAHEHRNYLPILGVLFAAIYYLFNWPRRVGRIPLGPALTVPFILLFSLLTLNRSVLWSNLYDLTAANAENHPRSARWQHELARALWIASTGMEDPVPGAELAAQARKHFLAAAQMSAQPAGNLISVLHIDSALGAETDAASLARIQQALSNDLVIPFAVNSFLNWFKCLSSATCEARPETVGALLSAFLGNNTLGDPSRGKLLAEAVQWALNRNQLDEAIDYARQAVATDAREIQHHLNLITLLTLVGALDEAEERLQSVRVRKDAYLHADKIEVLEQSVRKARLDADAGAVGASPR